MGSKASVMSIVILKPCKETFNGVGVFRDRMVVNIVKHIWESVYESTASSFEIAQDPTFFWNRFKY